MVSKVKKSELDLTVYVNFQLKERKPSEFLVRFLTNAKLLNQGPKSLDSKG